jgi:maleate isomerase
MNHAVPRKDTRTRLGLILPSVNTVSEPWLHQVSPDGTSIHTARMLMPDGLTPAAIKQMDLEDGPRALAQIMTCRPAAIGYACASSSIVQGTEYDRYLQRDLEHQSGLPCTTAMGAIANALRACGIQRLSLVSPYDKVIATAEHAFIEALGFDIVDEAHLGISSAFDLAGPSADEIFDLAYRTAHAGADGILLSCINFPAHLVIARLEKAMGKPVVTANQAILWQLMRLAGRNELLSGWGALFENRGVPPQG